MADTFLHSNSTWPDVPLHAWEETCHTLHMWTQVVGKMRLALAPHVNHWWNVSFHLTARGLTTTPMPSGSRTVQVDFDFIAHRLVITTSDGENRMMVLAPRTVADFYAEFMELLKELDIPVSIWTQPQEVAEAIPFEKDTVHGAYDAVYANRFWHSLVQADRIMKRFRSRFMGKSSPAHFFWGSFDHALTFFSGKSAPEHPGGIPNMADWVTREGYSHELVSFGYWPGTGLGEPAFYAYAYPTPAGLPQIRLSADAAFFNDATGGFILPYDAVRTADDPDGMVLGFFSNVLDSAAGLLGWDTDALIRKTPPGAE